MKILSPSSYIVGAILVATAMAGIFSYASAPTVSYPTSGPTALPTFAGSADAGSTVTIRSSTGLVVCTTTAVGTTYSCTPTDLPRGTITYVVEGAIAGSPLCSPPTYCTNGAVNAPTCNTCPSGQTYNGTSCVASSGPPPSTTAQCIAVNGTTSVWNGTACTTCTNGWCTNGSCNNGATDVPTCTPPVASCTNGANNPPTCNTCPAGYTYGCTQYGWTDGDGGAIDGGVGVYSDVPPATCLAYGCYVTPPYSDIPYSDASTGWDGYTGVDGGF